LQAASDKTIENIEYQYGPFDEAEIDYYISRLSDNDHDLVNGFQKNLIFNLFYKYFGDPISAYGINSRDYVKLLLAARKILLANNMVVLPYIISSKVERLQLRKSLNKKEMLKLQASPYYKQIQEKYKNDKLMDHILSIIATILVSDFRIIDYHNKEIDGKMIGNVSDMIAEEIMMYVTLI